MKTRAAFLGLAAGAAAIIVACSGTEDPPANVSPTGSSSGSTSAPGSVAPTASTNVGPTGTASTVPNTTGPSGGTGTSGGAGTSTGASSETCDPPPATPKDVTLGGVYDYGDAKTTRTFSQPMPNVLCLEGTAYSSAGEGEDMYEFWGAGMGLQVAPDTTTPYDATADNIAGVQFELTDWLERPVRVQMSQINDPAITDPTMNFEENAFVYGGSSPKATRANATVKIMFEDFELPSWSAIPTANQGPLDGSKLHSLQIQIANEPADEEAAYKFCVTNVQWLDACGQVVGATTLPEPEGDSTDSSSGDTGSGSTDSTSAGSDSTSGGSDSTSGGSDSTSGGSDSTSGEALNYEADIQPILEAKCAGCHASDADGNAEKWYGEGAEPAGATKTTIADRIQRADGAQGKMPPPSGTALTPEELTTLVDWAEE